MQIIKPIAEIIETITIPFQVPTFFLLTKTNFSFQRKSNSFANSSASILLNFPLKAYPVINPLPF